MSYPILYQSGETNFNHQGLGVLVDSISAVVSEDLNGKFELDLVYAYNNKLSKSLLSGNIIKVDVGNILKEQLFTIAQVSKTLDGKISVHAEHVSYIMQDLTLKPKTVIYQQDAQNALKQLLNAIKETDHGFTVVSDVSTINSSTWSVPDFKTPRDVLAGVRGSILDNWGGEYKFDNRRISLLKQRGSYANTVIAYGRNLLDFEQETSILETCTSIYPVVVKTDNDVEVTHTLPELVVDSQYLDKYANRKTLLVDFSDKFDDKNPYSDDKLRVLANAYIKANKVGIPKVTMTIKTLDLAKMVTEDYKAGRVERLDLADTVKVYFDRLGITTEAKVVGIKWNVLKESYDEYVLGERKATFGTVIRGSIAEVKAVADSAKKDAITALVSADGKNTNYYGNSSDGEPPNPKKGDIWFVKDGDKTIIKTWNGSSWVDLVSSDWQEIFEEKLTEDLAKAKVELDAALAEKDVALAELDVKLAENVKILDQTKIDLDQNKIDVNAALLEKDKALAGLDEKIAGELVVIDDSIAQAKSDIVDAKTRAGDAVDKANANVTAIEANTQLIDDVNAIANTAKSQAQTADTNAQTALTSANTAMTNANKAISDAGKLGENVESLSALATTAENNANTALTNARNAINQITQLNSDLEDTDGQVSTLTDNLNGFKQTVYTKTQTDTKIATVQSDVNGFKTSVSNTYATKSEIQGIKAGVRNYICEVAWTTKGYLATNGSVTNSNDNLVSSFIDVDASKAWIFQQFESATSGSVYVAFYDTNKNLVGSRVTLADGQTGTTASNVTYMRLSTPYKDTFGGRYKLEFGTVKSDWTQAPEDTQFIYINLQTQVDQTANAVSAKADKTTVDQISGRVDTAEGSITTMAGQINLKANQSTVDTITNRVSATEASFSLQDGKITTLTTKTNGLGTSLSSLTQDYNGFKTTVYSKTQTDTKISTVQSTVDNFKTTVSNTYSSKSDTDSKVTAVQANVDKIGNYTAYSNSADGTNGFTSVYPNLNFLEDGKFAKPISSKWNIDGTTISKDGITGYFKVIFNGTGSYNRAYYTASVSTIPIGQKYSVYIKAYSLEDSLNIKLGSVNTSQAVTVTKNGNVPKIYKVDGLVRGTSDTFGMFGGLTTTVGTLFVSEIKVEQGSIATPYMPSEKELTSDDIPKYVGYSVRQSENPKDFSWQPYSGLNSYKIIEATTSIDQNADNIALKANKSEVDTLSGKVSTAEGAITTMAGQIKLKANQTDVDTVKGRVTSAEGSISLISGQVALKANQADVNTITGKVSSLESSLTVQSGQITALNTKTDGHTTQIGSLQSSYNGLSSTVSTVQTSVSNINTSNTNLLIRKNEVKDSMVESDGTIKNWNGSSVIGYSDRISVTGGESLYFSQYYANMSADNYFRYAFYNSTGTLITRAVNNTINFLVVVPSGASYLRVSYATANKVKVERGNSNTGFVLNLEDTATFVQYSNLSQTVSSLQSTVANTYLSKSDASGTYADKVSVASRITQSATAVTSNVQSWTNNKLTAYSTTQQTATSITNAVANKADKSQVTQLSDQITSVVESSSQNNLVYNSTLQSGSDGWVMHTGFAQSSARNINGNYIINFSLASNSSNTWYFARSKQVPIGLYKTYSYAASLMRRTDIANSGVFMLGIEGFDKDGKRIEYNTPNYAYQLTDDKWTVFSDSYTFTNPDVKTVCFTLSTNGFGHYIACQPILVNDYKVGSFVPDGTDKSQITQLATDINLRVSKGDIVNQINISHESILIAGNKVQITGQTYIENGVISSAKISDLSASKLIAGTIDASVIVVDNINANRITVGVLNADRIGANTITVDKIQVANLASLSANLGTITAGFIDASKVVVDNINANRITVGTLSADRIAANSITATHISITSLSSLSANIGTITAGTINAATVNIININAGSITTGTLNADRIGANSITADKIKATSLDLFNNDTYTNVSADGMRIQSKAQIVFGNWRDSSNTLRTTQGIYIGGVGSGTKHIAFTRSNGTTFMLRAEEGMDYGTNKNVRINLLNIYDSTQFWESINVKRDIITSGYIAMGGDVQESSIQYSSSEGTMNFRVPGGRSGSYFWFNQRAISEGSFDSRSKLSLKNVKGDYKGNALDDIVNTNIVEYSYKNDPQRRQLSPIIDDINEIKKYHLPDIINDGESVSLYAMGSLSWLAIKQLAQKLENIEEKLDAIA